MKFVNTIVEDIVRIVMGLLAMGGGFWAIMYEAKLPKAEQNNIILFAGIIFAVIGFLLMPYVFPQVQKIFVFAQPYLQNVPVAGQIFGRRDGDATKQPPTPPSPGAPQ